MLKDIPEAMLKPVGTADGGFQLLLRDPMTGEIRPVAKVYATRGSDSAQLYARCLSVSFAALHLIDAMIEDCQPDGWDENTPEGAIWRRCFETLAKVHD